MEVGKQYLRLKDGKVMVLTMIDRSAHRTEPHVIYCSERNGKAFGASRVMTLARWEKEFILRTAQS